MNATVIKDRIRIGKATLYAMAVSPEDWSKEKSGAMASSFNYMNDSHDEHEG